MSPEFDFWDHNEQDKNEKDLDFSCKFMKIQARGSCNLEFICKHLTRKRRECFGQSRKLQSAIIKYI